MFYFLSVRDEGTAIDHVGACLVIAATAVYYYKRIYSHSKFYILVVLFRKKRSNAV